MSTIRREPASPDYLAVEKATILAGHFVKGAAQSNYEELQSLSQPATKSNIDALLNKKRWSSPEQFLGKYSETEANRGKEKRSEMDHFVRMTQACNKAEASLAKTGRVQAKAMKPYASRRTSSE